MLLTRMVTDPKTKVLITFHVRYVHCQRKTVNGWRNAGDWITSTKTLTTEGPFESYAEADKRRLAIMFKDTTMPETAGVFPRVEAVDNGSKPCA